MGDLYVVKDTGGWTVQSYCLIGRLAYCEKDTLYIGHAKRFPGHHTLVDYNWVKRFEENAAVQYHKATGQWPWEI